MRSNDTLDRGDQLRAIAWRIAAVYFGAYFLPIPLDSLPGTEALARLSRPFWDAATAFVGAVLPLDVVGFGESVSGADSDDEIARVVAALIIACFVGAVWSVASWRRPSTGTSRWLPVAARIYLGLTMLNYGLAKVFGTQFPPLALRVGATNRSSSPLVVLRAGALPPLHNRGFRESCGTRV